MVLIWISAFKCLHFYFYGQIQTKTECRNNVLESKGILHVSLFDK